MRIDSVELLELRIPLLSPFETSGWREDMKTCILVKLGSGSLFGFGECAVTDGPWYSYETLRTAWHMMVDFIVPRILGKEFEKAEDLLAALSVIRGHNMAKASFEMAFWDLASKKDDVSLSRMLGGTSTKVLSGVSVGIQESVENLVEVVAGFLDRGYRRVKLKIKPGNDIDLVSRLREEFPDKALMVDANGAYAGGDFERLLGLDMFGLLMIEQPFAWDDLVDHALLQKRIKTPVCLDESVRGLSDLKSALELDSCRVLNIKPSRVGGLGISRRLSDYCQPRTVGVWCGGLLETGVGRAANVALASLPGFLLPNDISASDRYFREDIVDPPFDLNSDGTIDVPSGPGIGVQVLKDRLSKFAVGKITFATH